MNRLVGSCDAAYLSWEAVSQQALRHACVRTSSMNSIDCDAKNISPSGFVRLQLAVA